ncbi:hypothetical protein [Kineococcus sp. SYSU DK018]|uniref:hypothetical protein n=1 Tax=Kineococcus sp. SYSU DK018 TaxID=3383139 RepID=UPI003D7C5FB0
MRIEPRDDREGTDVPPSTFTPSRPERHEHGGSTRTPPVPSSLAAVAITLVLAGCGAQPAAPDRPAPEHRSPFDDSTAVAEARSHLLQACPAQTDVARPVIQDPNESWVTDLGTLDEAVAFLWAQEQAMALDAWARCTFPDSYAGFRVEEGRGSGEPYGAVLSVTDAGEMVVPLLVLIAVVAGIGPLVRRRRR